MFLLLHVSHACSWKMWEVRRVCSPGCPLCEASREADHSHRAPLVRPRDAANSYKHRSNSPSLSLLFFFSSSASSVNSNPSFCLCVVFPFPFAFCYCILEPVSTYYSNIFVSKAGYSFPLQYTPNINLIKLLVSFRGEIFIFFFNIVARYFCRLHTLIQYP